MNDAPRRLTRLPQKQSTDLEILYGLLADTYLGHVASTTDGDVFVVPTAVVRHGDDLVWHGSTGSPWMRAVASGAAVAVSVAQVDAVVVARSTFESSLHYRSAVVRGRPRPLEGDEKLAALDAVVDRLIPARRSETRRPDARELAATVVVALPLDDWVLKVSDGWPEDTEADLAGAAWAGVVPLTAGYAAPLPAPDLRAGIAMPRSVLTLSGTREPSS